MSLHRRLPAWHAYYSVFCSSCETQRKGLSVFSRAALVVSTVQHPYLWLSAAPGGRQQLWAEFSLISSELEDSAASALILRRQEKKENGGRQDMQITPPPKERERSFPPAEYEKECSPSPSPHSTLNGTLSFDTHWPPRTHHPHNNTHVETQTHVAPYLRLKQMHTCTHVLTHTHAHAWCEVGCWSTAAAAAE